MNPCPKEQACAFMHCDENFKMLPSMSYYEKTYCHGEVQGECIRIKLESKYGALHVPSNMMPNGMPLPGTHRRDWSINAIEYKKYLENRDY